MTIRFLVVLSLALGFAPGVAVAKQLHFSGYDFKVKEGSGLGPGPNDWGASQAFIDGQGRLHLRYSERNGRWLAAEITSVSNFGFGDYEIGFTGKIAGLDRDVVFGFFNYPTADVGTDGTHEIDIEFARWGDKAYKPLNYTVWPAKKGAKAAHKVFSFRIGDSGSVHRFFWRKDRVVFQSVEIEPDGDIGNDVSWAYRPKNPLAQISRSPMPIHFNLWGFKGRPPSDGKPIELIVDYFKFTPAK